MNIDTLYPLVTEAIRRAEALEDIGAPDARVAFSEVSRLEERIASLLPLVDYEGIVARRGAVRAAIKAHEFGRAQELAARFEGEAGVDDALAADLEALKAQASALALDAMLRELAICAKELSRTQRSGVRNLVHEVAELRPVIEPFYGKSGNAPLAAFTVRVADLLAKMRDLALDSESRIRELNAEVSELQLMLVDAHDRIPKQEAQPRALANHRADE